MSTTSSSAGFSREEKTADDTKANAVVIQPKTPPVAKAPTAPQVSTKSSPEDDEDFELPELDDAGPDSDDEAQ